MGERLATSWEIELNDPAGLRSMPTIDHAGDTNQLVVSLTRTTGPVRQVLLWWSTGK